MIQKSSGNKEKKTTVLLAILATVYVSLMVNKLDT